MKRNTCTASKLMADSKIKKSALNTDIFRNACDKNDSQAFQSSGKLLRLKQYEKHERGSAGNVGCTHL